MKQRLWIIVAGVALGLVGRMLFPPQTETPANSSARQESPQTSPQ